MTPPDDNAQPSIGMAQRIAAFDWSDTLGPIETWPAGLKTTVDLAVQSKAPLVILWGPDGIMIYNDAYSVFAGGRHPQLLGAKVLEGWPEAADLNAEVLRVCLAGGTLEYKDLELSLNRTGVFEPVWLDLFYSPIPGTDGEPGGVIAIVVETTERVAAERELKHMNATLESRVEERTRELAQTQDALRQAQKMEAVGQLTGGIAHDFNNLLTGITGSLELIERRLAEGRTAGLQRLIDAAQTSARRAAALTQRLLAFSRRQTLAPKPTDINRLVAGMEDLIRRSVGPNVTVEVVGAGGLWTTRVDPSQLEGALLNLCINGRDAMAPEGGRLTIETANKWLDERAAREHDLPPGQYVTLCVTDTGVGMTDEVKRRAFDPFFTTKPLGQGTGLGLSMIYGFVRQSDGQVRIYSELGKGTTMCLYLPRHHGPAGAEVGEMTTLIDPGQGETVLVIDDEAIVRMLVVEVLREGGYQVLEAGDGPSGLKILDSPARIDLLITDVGLPGGMNGRQIADAARVLRPDLKVLFVTGYAENAVIGNGHLDPGMEVIAKPFNVATLANRIREVIDRPASSPRAD